MAITGTVRANSIFADSPENLTKAINLLIDGDTQSLAQMAEDDTAVPCAKALKVVIDDVSVFGRYVKWHLPGHADLECYSRPMDVTLDRPDGK